MRAFAALFAHRGIRIAVGIAIAVVNVLWENLRPNGTNPSSNSRH
jgi:hypothetical protein